MIALGCDHAGFELKQAIIKHLDERKIEYKDYGTYSEDSVDYAVYAEKTARAVANGECELGLLFCGTGALLSPLTTQQGESIPSVCHAVSITTERS